jgi:hypothetical protein
MSNPAPTPPLTGTIPAWMAKQALKLPPFVPPKQK